MMMILMTGMLKRRMLMMRILKTELLIFLKTIFHLAEKILAASTPSSTSSLPLIFILFNFSLQFLSHTEVPKKSFHLQGSQSMRQILFADSQCLRPHRLIESITHFGKDYIFPILPDLCTA